MANQSDQSRQVLPCPICGKRLRMPAGKRGTITCPECKGSLSADTTGGTGILKIEHGAETKERREAPAARMALTDLRAWTWRWRLPLTFALVAMFGLYVAAQTPSAPARKAPAFDGVEMPPPQSGEAWSCTIGPCRPLEQQSSEPLAEFVIKSNAGVNYLLKLTRSPRTTC